MELACPPCPRLLRASASFFGLGAAQRGQNRLRHVNGAPDFELATGASSRRLPALLAQADQKKGRLRVRRRQNLAALGYGRAHAHSILSMALREFCNEIRL
jgi:hypothetical protein